MNLSYNGAVIGASIGSRTLHVQHTNRSIIAHPRVEKIIQAQQARRGPRRMFAQMLRPCPAGATACLAPAIHQHSACPAVRIGGFGAIPIPGQQCGLLAVLNFGQNSADLGLARV